MTVGTMDRLNNDCRNDHSRNNVDRNSRRNIRYEPYRPVGRGELENLSYANNVAYIDTPYDIGHENRLRMFLIRDRDRVVTLMRFLEAVIRLSVSMFADLRHNRLDMLPIRQLILMSLIESAELELGRLGVILNISNEDPMTVFFAEECLLKCNICLLYTSPSPRDRQKARMPSSA